MKKQGTLSKAKMCFKNALVNNNCYGFFNITSFNLLPKNKLRKCGLKIFQITVSDFTQKRISMMFSLSELKQIKNIESVIDGVVKDCISKLKGTHP